MESSKSENMYVTSLSEGSLPPLKKQERIYASPHKKLKSIHTPTKYSPSGYGELKM